MAVPDYLSLNGIRLAELMIEFKMGVSVKETYQVKEMIRIILKGKL